MKRTKVLDGWFGLNEQDPWEPTGVLFRENDKSKLQDLAIILKHEFNMIPECNHETPYRIKITIEEQ